MTIMEPSILSKENYLAAKRWFNEALICYNRAWVILLGETNNLHGAIEALQHAHELCLKSLRVLVGLEWSACSKDVSMGFVEGSMNVTL